MPKGWPKCKEIRGSSKVEPTYRSILLIYLALEYLLFLANKESYLRLLASYETTIILVEVIETRFVVCHPLVVSIAHESDG